ncbi:MAG TPA: NAD-glutamate dehydrogenase, partial [Dokdonella sp.]|nr:NAD-glutamate dehydrogenase [Dokdonella sp.]
GNAKIDASLAIWKLLRNMPRWRLNHPGEVQDIAAAVERYEPAMRELRSRIDGVTSAAERAVFEAGRVHWIEQGFPEELSNQLAHLPALASAMDIALVARQSAHSVVEVAAVYFAVGEALNLKWLMEKVEELPVETRWHAHARGSLRDELNAQQRSLVSQMLAFESAGEGAHRVAAWMNRDDPMLKMTLATLADMRSQVVIDYPIVSVAVRRLAQLV